MLLAMMVTGCVLANSVRVKSRDALRQLEGFTPPIYILFFVLVGAKLNIAHLDRTVTVLFVLYLSCSSIGKITGAYLGARVSAAAATVRKYLPICLFSQAGVCIGLAILAANYFPGKLGDTIIVVVTAAVFVMEILGPATLKIGITRAGEAGLNVTAEDYATRGRVGEIMNANPVRFQAGSSLEEVLRVIGETSNLYYPVVDAAGRPVGVVSFDNVRKILNESETSGLILAADLMEPAGQTVTGEALISEARDLFDRYNIDYLAVVNGDGDLIGCLERHRFERSIEAKVLEIQKKVDALG
jgi:CBS domain-containing protein